MVFSQYINRDHGEARHYSSEIPSKKCITSGGCQRCQRLVEPEILNMGVEASINHTVDP